MPNWDYTLVKRNRGIAAAKGPFRDTMDWNVDITETLKKLGDEGWACQ
jgi:hypothetical protein